MEILNQLYERHFKSPVERAVPLQGQLGGSGRKIIRLFGGGFSRDSLTRLCTAELRALKVAP